MPKVKLMLILIGLVAASSLVLSLKARVTNPICTTFAVQTEPGGCYTCPFSGPQKVYCPNLDNLATSAAICQPFPVFCYATPTTILDQHEEEIISCAYTTQPGGPVVPCTTLPVHLE